MSKPGETSLLSHPSRRFKRRNFPGEDRFLEEEESKRKQSPGRKLSSLVEWLIRFERETRFPRRTMASLSGNLGRFEFIFPAFLRPCNQEFHSIKKLHFPAIHLVFRNCLCFCSRETEIYTCSEFPSSSFPTFLRH